MRSKTLADLKEQEWKRVFSSKVFEKKNDITPSKVFERIFHGAVIEALKYSPQYDTRDTKLLDHTPYFHNSLYSQSQ